MVFFGDGASNQGTLHEAMNLAGIWELPVIFICENNRYAESTPFEYSVAGESIAARAEGYGMPAIVADGQSVLEMYEISGEAVKRARAGEGPTFIEAQTYRYHGHFGADDPLTYRTQEEEDYYEARDCVKHMKSHLVENGVATEADIASIDEQALSVVTQAIKFADESPFPDGSELTTDVYISYG